MRELDPKNKQASRSTPPRKGTTSRAARLAPAAGADAASGARGRTAARRAEAGSMSASSGRTAKAQAPRKPGRPPSRRSAATDQAGVKRPGSRQAASSAAPAGARTTSPVVKAAPTPAGGAPRNAAPRPVAVAGAADGEPRSIDPYESDDPGHASEEETIESSKYMARAPRRFEEERFLFPQSYGVNKVRLLVRDPQWLFAHWDVDPRSFDELRRTMGERVVALSRLTLRVHDALSGGASVVLLPFGARSWYVRADATRRSYRAELGVTLPSGEFRVLAESNTVVMPRQAPSLERARKTVRYTAGAASSVHEVVPGGVAQAEHEALAEAGPWQAPAPRATPQDTPDTPEETRAAGGASDLLQGAPRGGLGGASDVFRR